MDEFTQKVLNAQAYIINLDIATDRLEVALKNIADAGFTRIERIPGVHASELATAGLLEAEWAKHGSPPFCGGESGDKFKTQIGRQGCMLSHLNVWKKISEMKDISDDTYFTIFEDDVIFHNEWKTLAPCYYLKTPKNFDILFIGNQLPLLDLNNKRKFIVKLPTYCYHAYILTRRGAERLYKWILSQESGVYTLDEIIHNHMSTSKNFDFIWYCWNAKLFDSTYVQELMKKVHTDLNAFNYIERSTGLVFQNIDFESFIVNIKNNSYNPEINNLKNHQSNNKIINDSIE
jgi:GR25 family glycosyltransferase involved in LPS biosynthesis